MKTSNIYLKNIKQYIGQQVSIKGWVANCRSSGGIYFLQVRDGSGYCQAIVSRDEVSSKVFSACQQINLETSIQLIGLVKEESRAPSGCEIQVNDLKIIGQSADWPLGKKEHGIDFLMNHRHLWFRSPRQVAILKIRNEIIIILREFFKQEGFILTDTPILTGSSCEGVSTLFKVPYFGQTAYLTQSGQLYLEALSAALGKVYNFGPTFRAEKSKTRRHLTEFWMLEAEVAWMDHQGNMALQEKMISYLIGQVLKRRKQELIILERDVKQLEKVITPFPHLTYDQAIGYLQKTGCKIKWGDDLGADEETILSKQYDRPLFIERYPAKLKAFYMKPDPDNPKLTLCNDLLAPEGRGEIIGASQRIDDLATLKKKLKEFKLKEADYQWYLDLRRYGTFPHSGFGLGLERIVTWICGLSHVREAISFPRLINRLQP
ncbi:MAG: asparagine--tRNA ligase [Candidatus Aenigmarchaeota archaeon]|nr:asparagine--tRNA ligase [Candidatus Aenigmarchaeota archaeon]